MKARGEGRGSSLVELLVATGLALSVLGTLTAAVGTGSRVLVGGAARGEAEDTVQLIVEAFTFDLRRAGLDPAAGGFAALSDAGTTGFTVAADLDGDGRVDATSEETTGYLYSPAAQRLSRIIGRQSLPLADGVVACAFRYLDSGGVPLTVPPTGLDAAARTRVRAVGLDVTLAPGGLTGVTRRRVLIALRSMR
jgi:hypothetical protein